MKYPKEQSQIEIKKSQGVRLWDVFGLGPAMIYIGARKGTKLTEIEKLLLISAGALTIIYNGTNYIKNKSIRDGRSYNNGKPKSKNIT